MLIVVAIIGILAAMAVPSMSRMHDAADTAKDQRNAQQIVSMYHTAQSMGLDFDGADKLETIANVVTGGYVPHGVFEGTYFGLPHISADQRARAAEYIEVAGEALQYMGSVGH